MYHTIILHHLILSVLNFWTFHASLCLNLPNLQGMVIIDMATQSPQGFLSNPTCTICERNEASHFCKCTDTPTLFCLDCSGRHNAKFPRAFHQTMPIAALLQDPQEYKRKIETLTKATAELRKNVERVEKCCSEFSDMMQNCINYLTEYRNWWLQQLQIEKEGLLISIETAIEEATNCLDRGFEPVSVLGMAVWKLVPEELQMFSYEVSTPDMPSLCESWAHYQNSLKTICERFTKITLLGPEGQTEEIKGDFIHTPSDIPQDFFAVIFGNSLHLHDINTQKSTRYPIPESFGNGTNYVVLCRNSVLCLGNSTASTSVYELNLSSLQLTPLPSLHTPRSSSGVVRTSHFVYVFGGYCDLKSCEKYALQAKQWQLIGDMEHPRHAFTPCTFQALIYLLCPCTIPAIETFSPGTETFAILPVTLPAKMKGWESVSFVVNGELCILTNNRQMGRWKIESERKFRLSRSNKESWSCQQPLIVDSLVYIADNSCCVKLEKFSLKTYTFIR